MGGENTGEQVWKNLVGLTFTAHELGCHQRVLTKRCIAMIRSTFVLELRCTWVITWVAVLRIGSREIGRIREIRDMAAVNNQTRGTRVVAGEMERCGWMLVWGLADRRQGCPHLLFTNKNCSKLLSTCLYKGSDDPRKSTTVGKKEPVVTGTSRSC